MTRYLVAAPSQTLAGTIMRVVLVSSNVPQENVARECLDTCDGRLLIATTDPRPVAGARLPCGVQGDRTWFPAAA